MNKLKMTGISQYIIVIFLTLVVILMLPSIFNYDKKSQEINTSAIKEVVEKYVVQCYATEGSYPPDLYYLEENYGLILQEDQFIYDYEIFASNIMPEVKIFVK